MNKKGSIILIIINLAVIYFTISSLVFLWRNPHANQMQIYREFPNVITFQKMEVYQNEKSQ